MMNYINTTIHVGTSKPFSVLHMSDSHLTLVDDRDDEKKHSLASRRAKNFPNALTMLAAGEQLAREKNIPIVYTGDMIDFVSYANLDAAKRFTDENDCFMAAGNHEFALYVGEAVEDAAYRNQSLARVQTSFKNDIRFSSRKINGVNFIAIDNSYYLIEQEQLDALKQEVALGLPSVLLMHTPIYTAELFRYLIEERGVTCAYVMNAPVEAISFYDEFRFRQQLADEVTREACAYISNTPLIKAVLTGHLHHDHQDWITPTLPQYITGKTTLREIQII